MSVDARGVSAKRVLDGAHARGGERIALTGQLVVMHGLDIGKHQRCHTLCIIFDHGLAHVVIKRALAVRGVSQARNQADVVERQLPVILTPFMMALAKRALPDSSR